MHEKTSPKAPQIELVSNPARWSFAFILGHFSDILGTEKYGAIIYYSRAEISVEGGDPIEAGKM